MLFNRDYQNKFIFYCVISIVFAYYSHSFRQYFLKSLFFQRSRKLFPAALEIFCLLPLTSANAKASPKGGS